KTRDYSEATAQDIDREVRRLVDEAYSRAKNLILQKRDKLELIAKALLEFETLDGSQIKDIIEHGEMRNPPSTRPNPPVEPPPLPSQDIAPGFPPGLTEQPA